MSQLALESLRRWDPERIGPYTLLGRLGAGAMGQVYLGRSAAGRLVAVKTIKIELAEEPGFRARFGREVAAARRVSGVFTAAVVAADADADVPWLATAYVPAPSLSQLVKKTGPLPVESVRWLAAGCAEALESIHLTGLIHRDLKPSNVLVAPDGPRVIDFGVARAAERVALTVTRGAVGTPGYMAPEQARDSQQASPASDVYSLGATLLFAATGHAPYHGETVMDVLVKLATEPPDLAGLPDDLAGLVTACLTHGPRDRPTSAKLLAGLGTFVEGSIDPADGHTYLPASAMTLIGGYARSPQPEVADPASDTADDELTGDELTSASRTELPPAPVLRPGPRHGAPSGRGRRPGGPPPGGTSTGTASRPRSGPGVPPQEPGHRNRRVRFGLAAAGCVVVAAALVGAGVYLGPKVDPGSSSNSDPGPGPGPGVPSTLPTGTSTTPKLVLSQPTGDPVTGYVIHGMGFRPNTSVNISLAGHGTSGWHPVVDPKGTFNYTIDQDHLFFAHNIPIGSYTVLVTGSGGRRAMTHFEVSAPPPSGGPPPAGRPPAREPPTGQG
ncbi:MAG TPA: serine/threonine-protein kinase [Streptosporangiaceae bacterium]|nr:serine/threonine-protein kinase [Streptosporangiaceae bacterium]